MDTRLPVDHRSDLASVPGGAGDATTPDSPMPRALRNITSWLAHALRAVAVVAVGLVGVSCTAPDERADAPATTIPPATSLTTATTDGFAPTTHAPGAQSTSPPTTVESRELYVAADGSDDSSGTAEDPWATLDHALDQLRAGDTLTVREGTYRERISVEANPGEPDAPIVVQAAADEHPVIYGLLWIRGPDHWVIDGINVTWDGEENDDNEHMVKITNGTGWTLQNAELWGAQSYAALLVASSGDDAPSGWTVTGNCIHDTYATNDTNQDHLVYVNTGSEATDGVVEDNLLFGADNGSGIKLGGSSEDSGGAHGVTVRHNTIVDTAQGILIAWDSSHNTITANLFAGTDAGYGHVRGYQLSGEGNVVEGNAGDDHQPFILNDEGYTGIHDGEDNVVGVDVPDGELTCDYTPQAGDYGLQVGLESMPNQ